MTKLNVQIIPAPSPAPDWGRVALLAATPDDPHAADRECLICGGNGELPRGDPCGRCGGSGRGWFVEAFRAAVPEGHSETAKLLAELPPGGRSQVTVELAETGGGLTNTGSATIVAGLRGEPMVAVYGRARCGGPHAVFYVHAALVIDYRQHRDAGRGSVSLVGVDREAAHRLGLECTVLATFADGEDPELTERGRQFFADRPFPAAALEAAKRKARDYHCRSAYYATGRGAHGPSGALTGAGAAFGGQPSPLKGPGRGY